MGNKPDYTISALNKITNEKGIIGAAWLNPGKDYITLKFNPFVVVPTGREMVIGMFPAKPDDPPIEAPDPNDAPPWVKAE